MITNTKLQNYQIFCHFVNGIEKYHYLRESPEPTRASGDCMCQHPEFWSPSKIQATLSSFRLRFNFLHICSVSRDSCIWKQRGHIVELSVQVQVENALDRECVLGRSIGTGRSKKQPKLTWSLYFVTYIYNSLRADMV